MTISSLVSRDSTTTVNNIFYAIYIRYKNVFGQ